MNARINLRSRSRSTNDSLISIREFTYTDNIILSLEPQSGFRLIVQPKYEVKIFPKENKDNQIQRCHQVFLTMEECYEQFPWFFKNE